MTSSDKKLSARGNRRLSTKTILLIIVSILLAAFMFYFLFKEIKDGEKLKKHIDKEHNHPG